MEKHKLTACIYILPILTKDFQLHPPILSYIQEIAHFNKRKKTKPKNVKIEN
jgi:hypothetical protein